MAERGPRPAIALVELKALLEPFGITHFYTDGWGAYRRHLDPAQHTIGQQHTKKIERKHTMLRARIKRFVRKTLCFSRTVLRHDLVIGLFIKRYALGYAGEKLQQLPETITGLHLGYVRPIFYKFVTYPPEATVPRMETPLFSVEGRLEDPRG